MTVALPTMAEEKRMLKHRSIYINLTVFTHRLSEQKKCESSQRRTEDVLEDVFFVT